MATKNAEQRIAGLPAALQALRELVVWPVRFSAEASSIGLKWSRGLLLHGPPGTGKTTLVRAIAEECNAHLISLSAGSVHKAYAGESERVLRDAFSEAGKHAENGSPAIIFIDEIDTLCPRRDARREQESRLVAQLNTLMDGVAKSSEESSKVFVVAATNRVNAVDPSLRRPGRFDKEILVNAPNASERFQILNLYAQNIPMDSSVDLEALADRCSGYVGADLEALCREAAMAALRRSLKNGSEEDEKLVTSKDWDSARTKVGPSVVRGVAADVPKVSWDEIGGLQDVKKKLQQSVEWPIKHSVAFQRLGLRADRGVLLHGPPGCSKTTLVKAVAHAAQATLFSLSGAEMYSMYVGEGEALLRDTFRLARVAKPSMIFFDEVDAIASSREDNSKDGHSVGERLLSTVLTEIDGLETLQAWDYFGVLVVGATNRPSAIDSALLRPGRFDRVIYVPPPDASERLEILLVHTKKMALAPDVDLGQIANATECFTGAELASLCREAAIAALREDVENASVVCNRHFQHARDHISPALTKLEIASYESFSRER
ncbi:hypothetical protein SELMODRAFT_173081 [Selaginella moellendorffii]|uniref:AAA+ ATPase domain-containing protein n=1 Tax=Selaginella moellendorffii TaxID=88036 RepID=D8RP37_SELML|nr:hypothetical protein SELMODRAFT_173081 [Selaginella moellendorffii]